MKSLFIQSLRITGNFHSRVFLSIQDSAVAPPTALQMIPTDELDEESEYELQVERQKHNELKKKIEILKKKLK